MRTVIAIINHDGTEKYSLLNRRIEDNDINLIAKFNDVKVILTQECKDGEPLRITIPAGLF